MFFYWLCLLKLVLIFISKCNNQNIDIKDVLVWGPGLFPDDIVMPARYFFIETNKYDGVQKLIPFTINLEGTNKFKAKCRIWRNILDRKDGSYIIRYKLYETCQNFSITITLNNEHIANSPYISKKLVYSEECNCPEEYFEKWSESYQCSNGNYEQIEKDLKLFDNVDFEKIRHKVLKLYDKPNTYSFCNYVVFKNQVFRKCYGKYVGFKMFMDNILLSLARKVKLPDIEFYVNLGDWPLVPKNKELLPIFSWCASEDTYDIVMPTYDITESTLENMGRVMLDMLSVQGNIDKPWETKIAKIFWRGRDSNRRRLELAAMAQDNPELFNVSLTNYFFHREEEKKYGKVEHVSFFKFFDYKYQVNIDGTVAAYRFPYLLAGDSLVFKQDSKYYEWFYHLLKPDIHFIQVNEDLSNLLEKLKWAMQNDDDAKKIAIGGQEFARKHLMPHNVFCYHAMLFSKWSEKIRSKIIIRDGMEEVTQPKSECQCNQRKKDEL